MAGLTAEVGAKYIVTIGSATATAVYAGGTLAEEIKVAIDGLTAVNATRVGNVITITDAAAGGVDPVNDAITVTTQRLTSVAELPRADVTPTSEGGRRISLTGLPVRTDMVFRVTIGGNSFSHTR